MQGDDTTGLPLGEHETVAPVASVPLHTYQQLLQLKQQPACESKSIWSTSGFLNMHRYNCQVHTNASSWKLELALRCVTAA